MLFETHSHHPLDSRMQNKPASNSDLPADEAMADADEPPDLKPLPAPTDGFCKKSCALQRKQSLLTRILTTSDSDSNHDDENLFSDARRAHSSASTWSRGSVASTAELTSDGHTSPARSGTPSPPLPPAQFPVAPAFKFDGPLTFKSPPPEPVGPLQKPQAPSNEQSVEAGLGRKRCITFACGRKDEAKKEEPAKTEPPKIEEPQKRPSTLRFVCPTRDSAIPAKPFVRHASPSPRKMPSSPRMPARGHRGSDSTVRNNSPKAVRKVPSVLRARKTSEDAEVDRNEATRFHVFAGSEEEDDDWTQEATCHKTRLTVNDTLRVENDLRKLGTEVEEEDIDEEEQLDEETAEYEDDLEEEDDDENTSVGPVPSAGYDSDEGFHSDDEEGFAGSDEETAADSDDDWWAPGRGRSGSSEPVEHFRSATGQSSRTSSIVSIEDGQIIPTPIVRVRNRRRKDRSPVKSSAPELPDSTDFVCGTLDEDRPVEQAYLNALRQRQAQKHKPVPQDFDPTFPASDPDMDEEDEESEHDVISDSDNHMFMHGHMEPHEDSVDLHEDTGTVIPRKRSPPLSHSPIPRTRLRSPPPTKRAVHRSPPPPTKRAVHRSPPPPVNRRGLLFGQSPSRHRSPPPHNVGPLRSPPPTRRPSLSRIGQLPPPVGLASRPQRAGLASSVPRNGHEYPRKPLHPVSDNEEGENGGENDGSGATADTALPTRGAIDIVKGLEKKRQLRREKRLEKHCRLRDLGLLKDRSDRWKVPRGKGAERMREVGLECAALKGHRRMVWRDEGEGATHILSY